MAQQERQVDPLDAAIQKWKSEDDELDAAIEEFQRPKLPGEKGHAEWWKNQERLRQGGPPGMFTDLAPGQVEERWKRARARGFFRGPDAEGIAVLADIVSTGSKAFLQAGVDLVWGGVDLFADLATLPFPGESPTRKEYEKFAERWEAARPNVAEAMDRAAAAFPVDIFQRRGEKEQEQLLRDMADWRQRLWDAEPIIEDLHYGAQAVGHLAHIMGGAGAAVIRSTAGPVARVLSGARVPPTLARGGGTVTGFGALEAVTGDPTGEKGRVSAGLEAMAWAPLYVLVGSMGDRMVHALARHGWNLRDISGAVKTAEGAAFYLSPQAVAVALNNIGWTEYDLKTVAPLLESTYELKWRIPVEIADALKIEDSGERMAKMAELKKRAELARESIRRESVIMGSMALGMGSFGVMRPGQIPEARRMDPQHFEKLHLQLFRELIKAHAPDVSYKVGKAAAKKATRLSKSLAAELATGEVSPARVERALHRAMYESGHRPDPEGWISRPGFKERFRFVGPADTGEFAVETPKGLKTGAEAIGYVTDQSVRGLIGVLGLRQALRYPQFFSESGPDPSQIRFEGPMRGEGTRNQGWVTVDENGKLKILRDGAKEWEPFDFAKEIEPEVRPGAEPEPRPEPKPPVLSEEHAAVVNKWRDAMSRTLGEMAEGDPKADAYMAVVDAVADWAVMAPENDPMVEQFVAALMSPEILQTMGQRPYEVLEALSGMIATGENLEAMVQRLYDRFQPTEPDLPEAEPQEVERPTVTPPAEEPPAAEEPAAAGIKEIEGRLIAAIGEDAVTGIRAEHKSDADYLAALRELEANLADIEAPTTVEVPEGNVFDVYHGEGRAEKGAVYAEGVEEPILGAAKYYTFSEREARAYGPEIARETVTTKNPLRITSDRELLKIAGAVDILTIEGQAEAGKKLRAFAEKHGHDAIVIVAPWGRDMNKAGEPHKRLRAMFGGSQLVVLPKEAKKPPTEEPPKKKPAAKKPKKKEPPKPPTSKEIPELKPTAPAMGSTEFKKLQARKEELSREWDAIHQKIKRLQSSEKATITRRYKYEERRAQKLAEIRQGIAALQKRREEMGPEYARLGEMIARSYQEERARDEFVVSRVRALVELGQVSFDKAVEIGKDYIRDALTKGGMKSPGDVDRFADILGPELMRLTGKYSEAQVSQWIKTKTLEEEIAGMEKEYLGIHRDIFNTPEVRGKIQAARKLLHRGDLSVGEIWEKIVALGNEIDAHLSKLRKEEKKAEERERKLQAEATKRKQEIEAQIEEGEHATVSSGTMLLRGLAKLAQLTDVRDAKFTSSGGTVYISELKALRKAKYVSPPPESEVTKAGKEAVEQVKDAIDIARMVGIEFRQPVKTRLADAEKVRKDNALDGRIAKAIDSFTAHEATRYAMNAYYWAQGIVAATDGRKLIVVPTEHSHEEGLYTREDFQRIEAAFPDFKAVLNKNNPIGTLKSADILAAGKRPPSIDVLGDEFITPTVYIGDATFAAPLIADAGKALLDLGIEQVHAYLEDVKSPLMLYEAGADDPVAIAVMPITGGEDPTAREAFYSILDVPAEAPTIRAKKKRKPRKGKAREGYPVQREIDYGTPSISHKVPAGPREMEGGVSVDDIWKKLQELGGATIRQGRARFASKSAGWFQPWSHVIRMRQSRPLAVMAHETGHALDKKLFGKKRAAGAAPKDALEEMKSLGIDLYGKDNEPANGFVSEGFAEFIAKWLMSEWWNGDDMSTVTPHTYRWFFDEAEIDPKVRELLDEAKHLYDLFYRQGSFSRVDQSIQWDDEGVSLSRFLGAMKNLPRRFRRGWEDDLIDWMMVDIKRASDLGRELDYAESLHAQALTFQATSESIAKSFLLEHAVDVKGEVTGKSLKEVLAPLREREREWWIYMKALRDLTLRRKVQLDRAEMAEKRPEMSRTEIAELVPEIDTGISRADAGWVVDQFESPLFREAALEYTAFMDRVLDFLVESGAMSAEGKEKLRERHPIYLPLNRVFDESERVWVEHQRARGAAGLPIKRLRGSQRRSRDPLTLTIQQVHNLLLAAQKARFARELVRLGEKEGMGWLLEKVPPQAVVQRTTVEALQKQLEAAGADLKDADLDHVLSVWTMSHWEFGGRPIFVIYRDGRPEHWELKDPELFRTLMEMDKTVGGPALKLLGIGGKGVRLGAVGANLGFAISNALMRDPMMAPVLSEKFKPVVGGWWQALLSALADARNAPVVRKIIKSAPEAIEKRAESGRRFRAVGGEFTSFATQVRDRASMVWRERLTPPRSLKERMLEIYQNPLLAIARLPGKGWQGVAALQEGIGRTELWLRNAEFEMRLEEGKEKYGDNELAVRYALYHAKDVLNNYSRAGALARQLSILYPFFTARIAGSSKELRAFAVLKDVGGRRNRKWTSAVLRALAGLTGTSLLLWFLFKDKEWYQELDEWEWRSYWLFPWGSEIIRIPKPWAPAELFSNKLEAILRGDDEGLLGEAAELARELSPISNYIEFLPILLRPIFEARTYRKGFGSQAFWSARPTASPWEITGKLPRDIVRPYTTGFAKWASTWLPGDWSPVQIDHMLAGYTGGLAPQILRQADVAQMEPSDWPVIGRFIKRQTPSSSKSIRRFRDRLDEMRKARGSKVLTPLQRAALPAFERAAKEMSAIMRKFKAGIFPKELAAQLMLIQARTALARLSPSAR